MSRLRIPLIRNQRTKAQKSFERGLAMACGIVRPEYLPLEDSVPLYDSFEAVLPSGRHSGSLGRPEMAALLRQAQSIYPDQDCMVFLHRHWFMGGIVLTLPGFLAKAIDLLDFDGDTILAVSRDGGDGIHLDHYVDPLQPGGGYTLRAWGDRWLANAPPDWLNSAGA